MRKNERGLSRNLPPHPFPLPQWGREFPEMKIRALKPLNRGKTSNIQHRTSNAEVSEDSRCHSMFGVGCFSGFIDRVAHGVSRVLGGMEMRAAKRRKNALLDINSVAPGGAFGDGTFFPRLTPWATVFGHSVADVLPRISSIPFVPIRGIRV